MPLRLRTIVVAAICACGGTPAAAQSFQWLPTTHYYQTGFADPIEPRMSIGVVRTDLLANFGGEREPFTTANPEDDAVDYQALAAIGATIPLFRFVQSEHGGLIFSAQTGVQARFRIENPSRDDLGQDWIVAGAFEYAYDQFSARARISHRSSHLGDEFVNETGADRIEFGGEAFDLNAAWTFPGIARVYGGTSLIFRSYTKYLAILRQKGVGDCCLLQLGADGSWALGSSLEAVAGIDWQTAERIEWDSYTSLAAGLTWRRGDRSAGFVARFSDGLSTLGQFFNTPERVIGLEFLVTL